MSYTGGGMYDCQTCPDCGSLMWNGKCENPDCKHHWHPTDEDDEEPRQEEAFSFHRRDPWTIGRCRQ